MPNPTVTPTGDSGLVLVNLAWLLASTARWQTITGKLTAAEAMESIYPIEMDDTSDSAEIRPRAVVYFAEYTRNEVSLQTYDRQGKLRLAVELDIAREYVGNLWDEEISFRNDVDLLESQMCALSGTATDYVGTNTHYKFGSFQRIDCGPVNPATENGDRFYGCVWEFNWRN